MSCQESGKIDEKINYLRIYLKYLFIAEIQYFSWSMSEYKIKFV